MVVKFVLSPKAAAKRSTSTAPKLFDGNITNSVSVTSFCSTRTSSALQDLAAAPQADMVDGWMGGWVDDVLDDVRRRRVGYIGWVVLLRGSEGSFGNDEKDRQRTDGKRYFLVLGVSSGAFFD